MADMIDMNNGEEFVRITNLLKFAKLLQSSTCVSHFQNDRSSRNVILLLSIFQINPRFYKLNEIISIGSLLARPTNLVSTMKIIITGATGFVGSEVLQQALEHPRITSVITITRKALPENISQNPKLTSIIHSDFKNYPPSILSQLQGADGCVWALGTFAGATFEQHREYNYDYTTTAVDTFLQNLAQQTSSKDKFRFVYTSGVLVVRDQNKSLWLMNDYRKMRGQTENYILDLAKTKPESVNSFEGYVARPGGICAKGFSLRSLFWSSMGQHYSLSVEELAAAMIQLALNGSPDEGKMIYENVDLLRLGRKVLAEKKA